MAVGTPDCMHVAMPAHGIPSCLDLRHDPYKLDLAFIVDGTDSVNRQDILTVIGYFTRRQSLNVRTALVEYYSHRTEDHGGEQASEVFCNFTETIADLTGRLFFARFCPFSINNIREKNFQFYLAENSSISKKHGTENRKLSNGKRLFNTRFLGHETCHTS